jgi:hypothetical protein
MGKRFNHQQLWRKHQNHGQCCTPNARVAGVVICLAEAFIISAQIKFPHCNLHFEIEPGYFYAAMYVSYALNVMEAFGIVAITWAVTQNTDSPWLYTGVILLGCLVLSPINFRYSRVLLLYWLSPKINYQPPLDNDDTTPYL